MLIPDSTSYVLHELTLNQTDCQKSKYQYSGNASAKCQHMSDEWTHVPVDSAGFLVCAHVATEAEQLHVGEVLLQHVHRSLGTLRQHVHAHRVARRRHEAHVQVARRLHHVQPLETCKSKKKKITRTKNDPHKTTSDLSLHAQYMYFFYRK